MILSKLTVEGFKRVKKAELELADVTILVGANGSGKSSIIQAVHLACCVLRQAESIAPNKTSTVAIGQLDYLPTDHYKLLGHKTTWGNNAGTPASRVTLTFSHAGGEATASCALRSARNAGISITGTVPAVLSDRLRKKRAFFSAYIPGISGIPNREEKRSKKVVLRSCSYGDSNIILRNALLLLQQENPTYIPTIERWIGMICGPVKISVEHQDEHDLAISCDATIEHVKRPLELIGTGYLQLIQIFSYILLFKPGVLLIDEPDIHLHPTVQERLVAVLAEVAEEKGLRILLTTHSPFIVRGASAGAKVYWLNDGRIESDDRHQVELLLGWGAFGKRIICFSEDSNTAWLKRLVAQWPELERQIAYYPGSGYKHVPSPDQAAAINEALGGKFKVMVHRDRDALTDDEVTSLCAQYEAVGVTLWCPAEADLEAYFCQPEFLTDLLQITQEDAAELVAKVLTKHSTPIEEQFAAQRVAHNQELYRTGGSPANAAVLEAFQARPLKGAKGKFVFAQLRNQIPGGALTDVSVWRSQKTMSHELAPDLRLVLEKLLGGQPAVSS